MLGLEGRGGQDQGFSDCVQDRGAGGGAGGRADGGGGGVGGGRERLIIQHRKPVSSRYNPATQLDVHLVIFSLIRHGHFQTSGFIWLSPQN